MPDFSRRVRWLPALRVSYRHSPLMGSTLSRYGEPASIRYQFGFSRCSRLAARASRSSSSPSTDATGPSQSPRQRVGMDWSRLPTRLLPVESARRAEHAATVRVGVEVEARHLRKQGLEMRRRLRRGEVLGDAEIRAAEHPDLAVAPGLSRDPLGHVVRVAGLRGGELSGAHPEGRAAAPGVDAHRHVSRAGRPGTSSRTQPRCRS